MDQAGALIVGQEHWTHKGDVKLFLWEKRASAQPCRGTIIFVHGSSMASTPAFDLPRGPLGTMTDAVVGILAAVRE